MSTKTRDKIMVWVITAAIFIAAWYTIGRPALKRQGAAKGEHNATH